MDQNKLLNTDVKCLRGGKIADMQQEVEKLKNGYYEHIALVAGGNDCNSSPAKSPTDIFDSYCTLIEKAKSKAERITVSSICPRITTEDVQQSIDAVNAGLIAACSEKDVKFADSTASFRLGDGTVNDGYLTHDGVHITKAATNKMVKCLDLEVKDLKIGACKDNSRNKNQNDNQKN